VEGAILHRKQCHTPFVNVSLAEFRFRLLGKHFFMEPSDYDDIPLYKVLYFVKGTVLLAE
jgi:hypothetical protein